ncbi:MAG: hypothetical protein GC136_04495 [Alphaproteobacteria bacterium]|nr:hypothetical protein [Alphaproteobacteria bacterium]
MSIPSAETALITELDRQISMLEGAIEKAHAGDVPLLGDFENQMNKLCAAVVKGSPEIKEQAETKLRHMLGQLEMLEVVVREKRETLINTEDGK